MKTSPVSEKVMILLALAAGVMSILWYASGAPYGLPLDDAWMYAVHARNLLEHGEASLQLGKVSHALTSPLWTLLLAGARLPTGDPVRAAGLLAIFCHLLLATGVYVLCRTAAGKTMSFMASLLTAFTGPVLWHSASGLETNLLAAALVWSAWAVHTGRWLLAGLVSAAALLTGLEGGVTLLPMLHAALRGQGGRRAALALLIPGVAGLALAAWNLQTFGWILPSTMAARHWHHGVAVDRTVFQALQDAWMLLKTWWTAYPVGLIRNGGLGISYFVAGLVGIWGLWRQRATAFGWLALSMLVIFAGYSAILPVQGVAGRYQGFLWLLAPMLFPLGLGYFVQRSGTGTPLPLRIATRALVMALLILAAYHTLMNSVPWRKALAANNHHMNFVHVFAGEWFARFNPDCRAIAARDIGAIAYWAPTAACRPVLIDLGAQEDPSVLPALRDGRILHRLAQEQGRYFLSLPITVEDELLCPNPGLRMVGPAGRRHAVDPAGKLRFVSLEKPAVVHEDTETTLLVDNAPPALRLWEAGPRTKRR